MNAITCSELVEKCVNSCGSKELVWLKPIGDTTLEETGVRIGYFFPFLPCLIHSREATVVFFLEADSIIVWDVLARTETLLPSCVKAFVLQQD